MAQYINLLECSFEKLRMIIPFWSISGIKEALGILRSTLKYYGGYSQENNLFHVGERVLNYDQIELELLRKTSIVRHELHRRMRVSGINRGDLGRESSKLIDSRNESKLKLLKRKR